MPDAGTLIYLLDDDPGVLRAWDCLLRAHGFATDCHSSVDSFLAAHDPERPGCLVLDVFLQGMDGLDLQETLRRNDIFRPTIFATGRGDMQMTVRAMRAGAVTFLPKPVPASVLLPAVQEALAIDEAWRQWWRERAEFRKRVALLTAREQQVLRLVAAGMLNKQIAAELGLAVKTVKVHRGRLMQKMAARSLATLVGSVHRYGASEIQSFLVPSTTPIYSYHTFP